MPEQNNFIKFLPSVFQTSTEKKFFDATFDQAFSKADNELLNAFVGRRVAGKYNPVKDYYIPEPSKDRTWWQLEATAFARDENNEKENIFFYDDLLNKIDYYGGNTLNQDRLFASKYYSWCPPIDPDMFINYQNYYWVEQGLPAIEITGTAAQPIVVADIEGELTYTTPDYATPPNLTLSTGMRVLITQDPVYSQTPLIVDNVGDQGGIRLLPIPPDLISSVQYEYLPWDSKIVLSNGRTIDNSHWDQAPWEVQSMPFTGDYITIARGALDQNAWSRTNKWYHIDVINKTLQLTNSRFPGGATRALRPIIQFNADLQLYGSGTQFRDIITYGYTDLPNGEPIRITDYQGRPLSEVNAELGSNLLPGNLVVFFHDDDTPVSLWDDSPWDITGWDNSEYSVSRYIFEVVIEAGDTVFFIPYTDVNTPILEGDIILIERSSSLPNNPTKGESWFYQYGVWQEVANDKYKANQAPLFQLYDHNYVALNDENVYPGNDFVGNEIFSYKVNPRPGAFVDPVLGFPIVYTSLGQASDIVFENDLMVNRNTYELGKRRINGYYYFKHIATEGVPESYGNSWNEYLPTLPTPPNGLEYTENSRQRVVDRYVVGFNSVGPQFNTTPDNILKFRLSVTPVNYPEEPDIIVAVDGRELKPEDYTFETINGFLYLNLTSYLAGWNITATTSPVVEAFTYTHDLLDPLSPGYFEIPQQLEANPNQEEIFETTGSNLNEQFTSIIKNQRGFEGDAFGGINNFRDTEKNLSLGTFILQNYAPLLKTMLISGTGDLEFINANRFSGNEYTKFKTKYLRTAQQLINQKFSPNPLEPVIASSWVDQIFKTINISKEFSNAFAYSYMVAANKVYAEETILVPNFVTGAEWSEPVILENYIDIKDPRNVIYFYNLNNDGELLLVDYDYKLSQAFATDPITVVFNKNAAAVTETISIKFYQDPIPTYVPSTPSKLGTYQVYKPEILWDFSYAIPTPVIVGHDGTRTVATGTYLDNLLLELEIRIYNGIPAKFRKQYPIPLPLETVKSGYFRETRYTREEYLDVTESYLNKWSAKYGADYRLNEYNIFSPSVPLNRQWMLWNYSNAKDATTGEPLNLPGNWKGIFTYYYDTVYPNTAPWEMLGFSEQPDWWITQYGAGIVNSDGQISWPSTNTNLWPDLENGIIRHGPTATFDPLTGEALPNPLWARPGLSLVMPVDNDGDIIPVPDIFNIAIADPYKPFVGFDDPWVFGDESPVEQAWMNSSDYPYNTGEFLYLMKPAEFGEFFFDTVGTEYSPADQYVQNDTYLPYDFFAQVDVFFDNSVIGSGNPFFAWMRPKNSTQIVHAESIEGLGTAVRYGYQTWISDYLLFLGKDITLSFGQKVRTLDVNLANKLAGFTNKDTCRTYLESVTPGATTTSLLVPTNNFDVRLHIGQPLATYSYSGVIIRALADGTFAIYGYDLINPEFTVLTRAVRDGQKIVIGGTPANWINFQPNLTYNPGVIVRYNGVYYQNKILQVNVAKFDPVSWTKLRSLPITGGINVTYYPTASDTLVTVPYGSILADAQEVMNFLIGWGDYLKSTGWAFEEVNKDSNLISDWLYSAKQFLFWLNTDWAPDATIQLSPLANSATLQVADGYPANVEKISNGVYSILDKYGMAINPNDTAVDRVNQRITVTPKTLEAGGIYYLQVSTTETEHVLMFDNRTSFNDVVYSPLYRARQDRLRFNGFRSKNWFGKMEAPGYLIIDNELLPNYDTMVNDVRYFYDPNIIIDNPSAEALGRHLIGYENKSFLDNLQVSDDVQYLFYQGMIRQKGTRQAFNKLFRSLAVVGDPDTPENEKITVYEEWALRLGNFGNTIEQVTTEFKLITEQSRGEVIVARLNYIPDEIGFVREVGIFNAVNIYTTPPKIVISAPTSGADNSVTATAFAVLDNIGRISRIDMSNFGHGYIENPTVTITPNPGGVDKLYAVYQGEIQRDEKIDNIIDIDIDETNIWTIRPQDPSQSLVFPTTDEIFYAMPEAGYANKDDVDWLIFDTTQAFAFWGTSPLNPTFGESMWIAKDEKEDWDIVKLVPFRGSGVVPGTCNPTSFPVSATGTSTIASGTISHIEVTNGGSGYNASPTVTITGPNTSAASATATVSGGRVTQIMIVNGGAGYVTPTITITTPGGQTGSGATAIATVSTGAVNHVTVTSPGQNYLAPPTVSFSGGNGTGAFAVSTISTAGLVTGVTITYGGTDYTNPPAVKFSPPEITNNRYSTACNSQFKVKTENSNQLILSVRTLTYQAADDLTPANDLGFIALQQIEDGQLVNLNNFIMVAKPIGINLERSQYTNTVGGISTTYPVVISWQDYALVDEFGIPLTTLDIPEYASLNYLVIFKTLRFATTPATLPSYVANGNKIWVDTNVDAKWAVYNIASGNKVLFREQGKLIDTKLFKSAQVFQFKDQLELVRLPIYDPFKGILPNLAEQNISYKSYQDPARYNITSNPRLYSPNKTFGPAQVGQLWWDFSTSRYFYYEQPIALDGSETQNDNLLYIRDYWGQLFPGSVISIYEWVASPVPPAEYRGSGTPRSTTDTVQISVFNSFTGIVETTYYFWVLNATNQPNLQNRTLAATEVARLLTNPKSQGYMFFAPIQQTEKNNSYMFYNISEILAFKGNNVQIQYRISDREDQKHSQWGLYREGDESSIIPEKYWYKMVDSLCAYTEVLPLGEEFPNGIPVTGGQVLPVPDPILGIGEKYGVAIRPRQTMFVDLYEARKILFQAANALLVNIPIRDTDDSWDDGVTSSTYWRYVNWYEVGFENAVPISQYQTIDLATDALNADLLSVGEIIKVIEGTAEGDLTQKRYALYVVEPVSGSTETYLRLIGLESSAIQILPTIYTTKNVYALSVELRQLLDAMYTKIFVDDYFVDINLLFFSMLNFVLSEQQNPYWVFKTSYIFIKEENIPLLQSDYYLPSQIENVISYINDVKPYHTQIRDYTSVYTTNDIAIGTAYDSYKHKITLTFSPLKKCFDLPTNEEVLECLLENAWTPLVNLNAVFFLTGWDMVPWDSISWDIEGIGKFADCGKDFIVQSNSTVKLSPVNNLYPCQFQLKVVPGYKVPNEVIAVRVDDVQLTYGSDYYVVHTGIPDTYMAYLFVDPGAAAIVSTYVLYEGGAFLQVATNPYRNENALGTASDNLVINVDTLLPLNSDGTVFGLWDNSTMGFGWDDPTEIKPPIDGKRFGIWDNGMSDVTITDPDFSLSFKENTGSGNIDYYRNNNDADGVLDIAITNLSETLQITGDDAFKVPTKSSPASIWINGELIKYGRKIKKPGTTNTWIFSKLERGSEGTAPNDHAIGSKVFSTHLQVFKSSEGKIWNSTSNTTTYKTEYTFIAPAPGGLWYAATNEAAFLRAGKGSFK